MRVLSIHKGQDSAGSGWLLSQAFKRSDITLRAAVRRDSFALYPHDLPWEDAQMEWDRADVVHLHNSFGTWSKFGANKPFVLHHNGTYYRKHTDILNKLVAEHGGRAVVSTLDLLDYGDNLEWSPSPFNMKWLAGFRKPQTGRLRVGHSPTNRTIKSTEAFLAACANLDVEVVLVERQPWQKCLTLKGTCDIYYDQVKLGYGCNSIEAWGMGIPVIAGAADSTLTRMRNKFGDLPFYRADESTIGDAIRALMDEGVRDEYAARGLKHAKRWHDGRETRAVLKPIYRQLAG